MKKLRWPFIIIATVVLVDQLTKTWAVNNLVFNQPVSVLGSFFQLTLLYNTGGAMGTNFGSSTYYLVSSILILLFLFYYIYANKEIVRYSFTLSFIAGGAIGNIIDRIAYGKVVDFLDFDFFDINLFGYNLERWWTFNIADAVISCSIVFLLWMLLFDKTAQREGQADPATAETNVEIP